MTDSMSVQLLRWQIRRKIPKCFSKMKMQLSFLGLLQYRLLHVLFIFDYVVF